MIVAKRANMQAVVLCFSRALHRRGRYVGARGIYGTRSAVPPQPRARGELPLPRVRGVNCSSDDGVAPILRCRGVKAVAANFWHPLEKFPVRVEKCHSAP